MGEGQDLGAFRRPRGGKERLHRLPRVRVDPLPGGLHGDPGALVKAQIGADLVLFDHGAIGLRRALGGTHQRLHRADEFEGTGWNIVYLHLADEILPHLPQYRGKGENLWKALYITSGDIIVYLDADIKNIHHRFCYGLLGPLLLYDHIKYTKAFYDRPIAIGKSKIRPTGGGRVTELVIRPLFSLFLPELTQILQPLSGEYAGYREIFENIPFPIGYGIETSMLLDICEKWGLDVIAQIDLERRIHRNQDTKALGRMAFVVVKTFLNRLEKLGMIEMKQELYDRMIQYQLVKNDITPDVMKMTGIERPPMASIPEYRAKFPTIR